MHTCGGSGFGICVYMCTQAHMCRRIHMCIHTYKHRCKRKHLHTKMHACNAYLQTNKLTKKHKYTHQYTLTHLHTYIHTYIHTHIHTYTHTHIHTHIHECSVHTCMFTSIHTYMLHMCMHILILESFSAPYFFNHSKHYTCSDKLPYICTWIQLLKYFLLFCYYHAGVAPKALLGLYHGMNDLGKEQNITIQTTYTYMQAYIHAYTHMCIHT